MHVRLSEIIGDYSMAASRKNDAPGNLRAGQYVIGYRGNVLSDEESDAITPRSVVVLVTGKNGKFLAVSRGLDEDNMNMPGGGIEPGEEPEDAARRELWEETGLIADVVEIYREGSTIAFRAIHPTGSIRSSEEGITKWVEYDDLAAGQYSDYFRRMIKHLSL
jgi:8-oxo-dGTP pyrophosphatase MutT (NUDIX family)